MSITERRKQFLEALKELYIDHQRPIHYEEVAKKLSVSPATAYDMLQALLKEGYLEAVYIEENTKRGRAKVFFKPKEEVETLDISAIEKYSSYSKTLIIVLSFLLLLFREIKLTKDVKSAIALILGNLHLNADLILITIPFFLLGYMGKRIYEIIPPNNFKSYIEEYFNAINQLADEEKKALSNLIFKIFAEA